MANKGDDIANKYKQRISTNMQMAAIFLQNKIKVNLNNSTEYRKAGTRRLATTPAKSGAFPRKITGFLQKSIQWALLAWDTVKVGTTVLYGKILELTGHSFLRRTYLENKEALKRIILK